MFVRRSFGPQLVALVCRHCVPVVITGGNNRTLQTATGKVLGAAQPNWDSDLDKAFREFANLPEAERKPAEVPLAPATAYRLPPPPEGLVVRVYTRGFERDRQNTLRPIELQARQYSGPQRDFLWLTAIECKNLFREDVTVGSSYPVPTAISQRIVRNHLVDSTICLPAVWSPTDIRTGTLALTVDEYSQDYLRYRLDGSAKMSNHAEYNSASRAADFEIRGTLRFDRKTHRCVEFNVVALGDYRNTEVSDYLKRSGQRTALTLGIAFELAAPDSLGYGTVPYALWDAIKSSRSGSTQVKNYFGLNPYAVEK